MGIDMPAERLPIEVDYEAEQRKKKTKTRAGPKIARLGGGPGGTRWVER
jgi:hypothetical protein